jgi:polysaccharide deacetylase family protein (PEP-CTERM system associated)
MLKNILSVDVEEFFHAEYVKQSHSGQVNFRTPDNLQLILRLFKDYDVKATFFVVGEIAEKFPWILSDITEGGHEVAFHSWSHLSLRTINNKFFKEEISKFKKLCPSCIGYRAPSFSLNNNTRWALKILLENGFHYDSSVFPTFTPLYGMVQAPIWPYIPSAEDISKETHNISGIREFPLAVYEFFGLKLPIAGGFWLRFWDINLLKKGIKKLNAKGIPAVLYVHTWELDPPVTRVQLSPIKNFVTYHNLSDTKNRLLSIMDLFPFTTFKSYLEENNISVVAS